MNLSDFKRMLGADPGSHDPEFLAARASGPEFAEATALSDRFERSLRRALRIPPPPDLLQSLASLAIVERRKPHWRPYALAAGIVLCLGVALVSLRSKPEWTSVGDYLAQHYSHDGAQLLQRGIGHSAGNVDEMFAQFGLRLSPGLARRVGLIKHCPTPGGRGLHLVLNLDGGAVTVILMPATRVNDGELLEFDGMRAQLVSLQSGSAALIGSAGQELRGYHDLLQAALLPEPAGA